mmetsp:Transcript_17115/g.48112  ORF Transcript_17115/g.48112 Transcript_17115/m.48112 type:complete len:524 (-) Transcript_17115:151-1722(-)
MQSVLASIRFTIHSYNQRIDRFQIIQSSLSELHCTIQHNATRRLPRLINQSETKTMTITDGKEMNKIGMTTMDDHRPTKIMASKSSSTVRCNSRTSIFVWLVLSLLLMMTQLSGVAAINATSISQASPSLPAQSSWSHSNKKMDERDGHDDCIEQGTNKTNGDCDRQYDSHPTTPDPSSNSTARLLNQTIHDMMDWITNARGGYISPKLEVRLTSSSSSSSSSSFGIFAKQRIEADEVLFTIPRSLILYAPTECGIVHKVQKQLWNAQYRSRLATPYAKYLHLISASVSSNKHHFLPALWSTKGKALLAQLTSTTLVPTPQELQHQFDSIAECGTPDQPILQSAWQLVTSRADDTTMIPFYDFLNHSPTNQNTKHAWMANGFQMIATTTIDANEQVLTSYNQCSICDARIQAHYGVPELFRDYGFVSMHGVYKFMGGAVVNYHSDDKLQTTTKLSHIFFIDREFKRLQQFHATHFDARSAADHGYDEHEWERVWELHDAYATVFRAYLDEVDIQKYVNGVGMK